VCYGEIEVRTPVQPRASRRGRGARSMIKASSASPARARHRENSSAGSSALHATRGGTAISILARLLRLQPSGIRHLTTPSLESWAASVCRAWLRPYYQGVGYGPADAHMDLSEPWAGAYHYGRGDMTGLRGSGFPATPITGVGLWMYRSGYSDGRRRWMTAIDLLQLAYQPTRAQDSLRIRLLWPSEGETR